MPTNILGNHRSNPEEVRLRIGVSLDISVTEQIL